MLLSYSCQGKGQENEFRKGYVDNLQQFSIRKEEVLDIIGLKILP